MNLFFLVKKELKHYFNSPIAYIILVTFFILSGWFFTSPLFLIGSTNALYFYMTIPLFLIFFAPAVSMRLFAEEKRQGTIEHLQTLPLTDSSIVMSKFLGSIIFLGLPILGFFFYHSLVASLGTVEWGVVTASIIGTLLLTGTMLSLGMFVSSLTKNQIVAFILTALTGMLLILAGSFLPFLPWPINGVMQWLDMQGHMQGFVRGVIDIKDMIFFCSLTTLFLVLTQESLRSRHS